MYGAPQRQIAIDIAHAGGRRTKLLQRSALASSARRLSTAPTGRADVVLVEREGGALVVKDFRPRGILVRNTIGRFSVARECRAYERLQGIEGIARFGGRVDAHALAYAYRAGSSLQESPRGSLPAAFFAALERLLAAVHERGVAIADLHHRNVLVEPAREASHSDPREVMLDDPRSAMVLLDDPRSAMVLRPGLIDFSLALVRPSSWNLPGRWLFRRAQELDRIALARIRARYEFQACLAGPSRNGEIDALSGPGWYRVGRRIKSALRRLRGKRP
jgi:hypothetical protein